MKIPTIAEHRGVGIFDEQDAARVAIVKAAIDNVLDAERSPRELFDYADDPANPPEARILAGDVLFAAFGDAKRAAPVDLVVLGATVAGLDGEDWRDEELHCMLLDFKRERAVPRDAPLPPIEEREARNRQAAS